MDPQIKQMLKVPVMWEAYIGKDARGVPQYASAKQLMCYPANVYKAQRSDQGEVIVSRTVLYFEATPDAMEIGLKDRLTLPDGSNPPIYSKDVYVDGRTGINDIVEVGI